MSHGANKAMFYFYLKSHGGKMKYESGVKIKKDRHDSPKKVKS